MNFHFRYIIKTLLLPVIVLLSVASTCFAQDKTLEIDKNISSSKMKDRGDFALKSGDIYTALFYYEEVVRNNPDDIAARYKLAELYELSRNYSKAAEVYSFVNQKAFNQYPMSLYKLGIMQKMSGNYEEAKESLNLFKKQAGNLGDRDFKRLLSREISGCDSGIVYQEFPDHVIMKNAGASINDPHVEFSPYYLDSTTIVFGSLREDALNFYDIGNELPKRQIYKAELIDGEWKERGLFETLNDERMDMGNVAYSAHTGKYYFTKCKTDNKGKVACKLYVTEKVKGKYKPAKLLPDPVNIEGYSSTQPCVMYDTAKNIEYLYYVSDRPDGKGGYDIWYTYHNKRQDTWTNPRNASFMNSPETDCTPFYHAPTETFYFSTNGRATAGGLDVFKTSRDEKGRYSIPENLSFPINSPQDDLGFHLSENGKDGFIVSNRPGGTPFFHETCCDDIFAFEIFPPKLFEATLDLTVSTTDTSCLDKILKLDVYDLKTKEIKKMVVRLKNSCNVSLALNANTKYTFKIDQAGFEGDSLVVLTRDMASTAVIAKTLELKPKVEVKKLIAEAPQEGEAFVLNDIQYKTDQRDLSDEAKAVLDSILIPFLQKHPKDIIQISSHTDDVGSKKYNEELSQSRADFVAKYLIAKGIPVDKIEAKGHGENKPIAPNLNSDGTGNVIGRSQNRRTEFLLVKTSK